MCEHVLGGQFGGGSLLWFLPCFLRALFYCCVYHNVYSTAPLSLFCTSRQVGFEGVWGCACLAALASQPLHIIFNTYEDSWYRACGCVEVLEDGVRIVRLEKTGKECTHV
jgi:hypothetical protein